MARAARAIKPETKAPPEKLDFRFELGQLPSSQHRAGLAGLVLVARYLARNPNAQSGTCEVSDVTASGATLRIDGKGLDRLFDEIHGADWEETTVDAKWKGKPPMREVQQTVKGKNGKETEKTRFVYRVVVPKGSFLSDPALAAADGTSIWLKLWRDMFWSILRGVPATRLPYQARADRKPFGDSSDTWEVLQRPSEFSLELPSTYYLGAQAITAENVSFQDRARDRFLLHFWPFAAQIYCPVEIDREGTSTFRGFAIAIPDVCDLAFFCDAIEDALPRRSPKAAAYRPRGAVIDLAAEGALRTFKLLEQRLAVSTAGSIEREAVWGIDVIHAEKEGKNVRILNTTRVDPDRSMIDEYTQRQETYWDVLFRRQRLVNIIARKTWHAGFDALFSTNPIARTFASDYFRHDAREAFKVEVPNMEATQDRPLEKIIYDAVGTYLSRRLESKFGLKWETAKGAPQLKENYDEKREKLAKDAFLAIRSRSGSDFVDYFSGTICSVSQHLPDRDYALLTQCLLQDTATVRTLTLLALSARG